MAKHQWKRIVVFVIISYLLFWRGLSFTFWKDDWFYIWMTQYDPRMLLDFLLHPGTLIEFFSLTKILGMHPFLWQHVGILLRAAAAYAVSDMAIVLSGSLRTGWIAGLLFAAFPGGVEAVNWPSAHVTYLAIVFWCKGIAADSVPLMLAGFAADPVRILPVIWMPFVVRKRRWSGPYISLIIAGVIVGVGKMVQFFSTPRTIPSMNIIFHYFNGIWNLVVGWMVTVPHIPTELSHSVLVRPAAIGGAIFVLLAIVFGRKSKLISFCIAWVLFTVFIQWMFDIRLIPAVPHRYFVVPSVGLVIAAAIVLNKLKTTLIMTLLVAYGIVAFVRIEAMMLEFTAFRSEVVVDRVWQQVQKTVAGKSVKEFIFSGDEPITTNVAGVFGTVRYALLQGISDIGDIPNGIVVAKGKASDCSREGVYAFQIDADGAVWYNTNCDLRSSTVSQ